MNIFITGASRGIGRATALYLAKKGYRLVLAARNEQDLQNVVAEINRLGGIASYVLCDVTDEIQVQNAIQQAIDEVGTIEVLINNAGVGLFKPLEEITLTEWQNVMDSNVKSTFLCCKNIIPHFKNYQKGHIIIISSDAAKRTFANGTLYCASKFAQEALASALRKEVKSFGIKLTIIYPGLTDTNFNGTQQGEARKKDWLRADDIAQAIEYAIDSPKNVVIDEIMLHPITQEY